MKSINIVTIMLCIVVADMAAMANVRTVSRSFTPYARQVAIQQSSHQRGGWMTKQGPIQKSFLPQHQAQTFSTTSYVNRLRTSLNRMYQNLFNSNYSTNKQIPTLTNIQEMVRDKHEIGNIIPSNAQIALQSIMQSPIHKRNFLNELNETIANYNETLQDLRESESWYRERNGLTLYTYKVKTLEQRISELMAIQKFISTEYNI